MGKSTVAFRFGKIVAPDVPLVSGWTRDSRVGEVVHPFSDAVLASLSTAFATKVICRVDTYKRPGVTHASVSDDIAYTHAAKYLAAKVVADMRSSKLASCKNVSFPAFPDHTALDTTELEHLGIEAPSPAHVLDQFS